MRSKLSESAASPGDVMGSMVLQLAPVCRALDSLAIDQNNRTEKVREAMRRGESTASALGVAAGMQSALVSSLLKHDLKIGRVRRRKDGGGRTHYELEPSFDESLQRRLREAAALLRRNGWRVTQA